MLTDQGLSLICQYISLGFYPHLQYLSLEGHILKWVIIVDNLLTDKSVSEICNLIEGGFCPEMRSINLSCIIISPFTLRQLYQRICRLASLSVLLRASYWSDIRRLSKFLTSCYHSSKSTTCAVISRCHMYGKNF